METRGEKGHGKALATDCLALYLSQHCHPPQSRQMSLHTPEARQPEQPYVAWQITALYSWTQQIYQL